MTADDSALLSTLRSLPDVERVAAERSLVALADAAALGDLVADVAHDVANPLFGVLGLADLLLEDVPLGSEHEARLRLLRQTALEMKGTLQALLDFVRAESGDGAHADAAAAAARAVALARHGAGTRTAIEERYPDVPIRVACDEGALARAVLQLLLAARTGGAVRVEVSRGAVRVAPAGRDGGVRIAAAARIAADQGGALETEQGAYVLRLRPA
jgi:signal transduction histidine kinase